MRGTSVLECCVVFCCQFQMMTWLAVNFLPSRVTDRKLFVYILSLFQRLTAQLTGGFWASGHCTSYTGCVPRQMWHVWRAIFSLRQYLLQSQCSSAWTISLCCVSRPYHLCHDAVTANSVLERSRLCTTTLSKILPAWIDSHWKL